MNAHAALRVLAFALWARLAAGEPGPERPAPTPQDLPRRPAGAPGLPLPGSPGPWDRDVMVYRASADGRVETLAAFARAGVPTLARMRDGRLIAAHQHFPENDPSSFDQVAVRFSSDEGRHWTAPQVIRLEGLPAGMRFPFDPTLVPLPDGRVRLYFTSLAGQRFEEAVPAIYSALSTNGIDYTFEPGQRFGVAGRPVIDCAVVLHQGRFHLFAPNNGGQPPRPEPPEALPRPPRPPPGLAYHAVSQDGLKFTRADDVQLEGPRQWLGNAQSDGRRITFFGTGNPAPTAAGPPRGSIWIATSEDGQSWQLAESPAIFGGDPGAVAARDGSLIVAITGEPRPGTPSSRSPRADPRGQRPSPARPPPPQAPCCLEVVDQANGWPVPLVELRTTHQVRLVSDNAGRIAFDLPELMGRETWFDVLGHGYEVPKDGFGNRGVRLKPEPGKTLSIQVRRCILAKRLGRLTGGGLFAESQKLGRELDWRDSGILGCDSVQNAVHHGRLFWVWGDTTVAHYPLGIFHGTGATTPVQPLASFTPPLRLKLDYFSDEQNLPRPVATLPGAGPTWVTGFVSLPDKAGTPHLVGACVKITPPLDPYLWILAVWNERTANFEPLRVVWTKSETTPTPPPLPEGHPAFWKDQQGREWLLFGNPLPTLRCSPTFEAWQDPASWEVLRPQPTIPAASDGAPVKPHSGSIAWHPWRKRWVTVFMQALGQPSAFGELWYAEADSPLGPWGPAIKVLTHDNYTFYNPRLHPEFIPAGSPWLFFEGTYTMQFANHPPPTPRYDYNQVLYRLDLDDPALAPARQPHRADQPAPSPRDRPHPARAEELARGCAR